MYVLDCSFFSRLDYTYLLGTSPELTPLVEWVRERRQSMAVTLAQPGVYVHVSHQVFDLVRTSPGISLYLIHVELAHIKIT